MENDGWGKSLAGILSRGFAPWVRRAGLQRVFTCPGQAMWGRGCKEKNLSFSLLRAPGEVLVVPVKQQQSLPAMPAGTAA